MKRFILCFVLGISFATFALAQTSGYAGFGFIAEEDSDSQPSEEVKKDEPAVQDVEVNATAESKEQVPETVTTPKSKPEATVTTPSPAQESDEEEEEGEEEEREDDEKKIFLALNNVKSTLAAVRSVSYCSAVFVLFNNTKKEIQDISGSIGIGNQRKDFKFKKVAAGASVGWPLRVIGDACESIFALPDLQIKTCKVQGMSDKKCRAKLRYVPLNANAR